MSSSFKAWLPSFEAGKKKPKDTSLYDLLGIEYTATEEEIKRAYKKTALRLHPDKGGDPAEFDKMKRAYDVLKDEKKRAYYDRYGPKVVAAMEQGGPESAGVMMMLLLSQKRFRALIVLAVLVLVGVIDLLPVLISVKWDGADWSWGLAFFPIFFFLGLLFIAQTLALCLYSGAKKQEQLEEDELPASRLQLASMLVLIALQILFFAFFAAKLDGLLPDWSWYEVVIPLAVFELWLVADRWGQLLLALREMRAMQERVIRVARENMARAATNALEEDPEAATFIVLEETDRIRRAEEILAQLQVSWAYLLQASFWPALRMATWWLLAARAGGQDITGTWFLTAIPLIVGAALHPCLDACLVEAKSNEEGEEGPGRCGTWCSMTCFNCIWLLIWLLGMGKLDNDDVYSAFAIWSIWFALSALLLLPLLTLVCVDPESILSQGEEEENKPQPQQPQQPQQPDAAAATTAAAEADPEAKPAPADNVIILT